MTQEVERHLERMAKIKRLMPAYRNYRLHGAVAGMTLDAEAIALAEREGLWVLGQSGETVEVKNRPGFEPRVW